MHLCCFFGKFSGLNGCCKTKAILLLILLACGHNSALVSFTHDHDFSQDVP